MDRPTCSTCVFWAASQHRLPDADTPQGKRVRLALQMYSEGATIKQISAAIKRYQTSTKAMIDRWTLHGKGECRLRAEFVARQPDDFCGEHPDFPAYIESRKAKQ